jgi:hypothetical protein
MAKVKLAYFRQNASKKLKFFLVIQNGPGYNKNNKTFESAMLDIHDGMHSTMDTSDHRTKNDPKGTFEICLPKKTFPPKNLSGSRC